MHLRIAIFDDPFFDSLKSEYTGSENSKAFVPWFQEKAREGRKALVFEDEEGVGAFVCLKPEAEEIPVAEGGALPAVMRLKITTIKIADRFRGQRIGEGAIGLTLWQWQKLGYDEVYLTVFEDHFIVELKSEFEIEVKA